MAIWEIIVMFLSELGSILFWGDSEGDGIVTKIGCWLLITALIIFLVVLIIHHYR